MSVSSCPLMAVERVCGNDPVNETSCTQGMADRMNTLVGKTSCPLYMAAGRDYVNEISCPLEMAGCVNDPVTEVFCSLGIAVGKDCMSNQTSCPPDMAVGRDCEKNPWSETSCQLGMAGCMNSLVSETSF